MKANENNEFVLKLSMNTYNLKIKMKKPKFVISHLIGHVEMRKCNNINQQTL